MQVLAQTYRRWELILVDDNSADDTAARCRDVLKEHTQNPVTFIRKGSTGIVDGLNRGLEVSRCTALGSFSVPTAELKRIRSILKRLHSIVVSNWHQT